jgi:tetratricopeptide (TPR) repeat protein
MNEPTDYEAELARIDEDISALEAGAFGPPLDTEKATRFVYLRYQRGSLKGDFDELEAARTLIDHLIPQVRHASDLYFLKANLDFKFHRLADVRRSLEADAGLRESPEGRALRADLDFQEGRYGAAEEGYERLIREDRAWDSLARLAHVRAKMGDADGADRLYQEAEDELTAKEMRHYSWVELQRGLLDLTRGRYAEARAHYVRAERAYSGHWTVEEHMAELLGVEGEFDAAAALYEKVCARVPRPEFYQSLGELYQYMGCPEQAEPWLERARSAYLASAERGDVHYYHHLADFYADVREDGAEAVRWARRDVGLRRNFSTLAALAWALYRAGQLAESVKVMDEALASGAKDAHLFFRAGTIRRAADGDGEEFLRMAAELNPRLRNFHVHR